MCSPLCMQPRLIYTHFPGALDFTMYTFFRPVNLLNQSSYHFVYVIIFGAMSSDLLKQTQRLLIASSFSTEFWYFTSDNSIASSFIHTGTYGI